MMSPGIVEEASIAGRAVLYGAFIVVVYDLLRIFRRVFFHGNILIGVEDFLFWIWTSLWIFSVLYRENDGSLRMYTILAMLLGMVGYHWVFGDFLVEGIAKILNTMIRIFCKPFQKLKICLKNFEKKLKNFLRGSIMKKDGE